MKSIRQILSEALTDVPEMGPEDVRAELHHALFMKHLHRLHHKRIFDMHERGERSEELQDEGRLHYNNSVSYGHQALELHQLLKTIDPSHNVATHWNLESSAKKAASEAHYGTQTS